LFIGNLDFSLFSFTHLGISERRNRQN